MEPSPSASGSGEGPPSPAPTGDGGGAGGGNGTGGESSSSGNKDPPPPPPQPRQLPLSRYESQKRRDWNTFLQYLKNHKPPLSLSRSGGTHVIEFLNYLDQFGKTKVHSTACAYFGHPNPPATCACPLRQAWGSLDALIGRLRAAYEENGGRPESNPFGARAVRIFLREVKESQAKARGKPYEKKKRKRFPPNPNSASSIPTASETAGNEPSSSSTSTACASATANSSSAIVGEVAAAAAAATGGGDSGSGTARLEGSVSLLSGSS